MRLLAVGAMTALTLVGGPGCSADDSATPSANGSRTSTTAVAPSSTPPLDDGCDLPTPSTWEVLGTIHTIVPGDQPVDATVQIDPQTVCPGGEVHVTLTIRNTGGRDAIIDSPRVVLSGGGVAKWELTDFGDTIEIDDGESVTVEETARIPLLHPGEYTFGLYGYSLGGTLTVADPADL